jgi:tripartite-type tricarboxylate transporter receptor subunit TctC
VAVETKPSTDAAVSATVATQIAVPCPVGSPADIAARHIAKVLSAHHGHDYQVKNHLPDAAREIAQQPDSQTVLFFVAHANGMPVCGE